MVKKAKANASNQECWLIIKGSKHTHFKSRIEVDYTPKKGLSTLPKFNRDRMHWTPSFKVPYLYEGNGIDYLAEHENKVKGTLEKDEENILIPRPRPKTKNYCAVCAEEYQDYLDHIGTKEHIAEIRDSRFHPEIVKICEKWKRVAEEKRLKQLEYLNTKTSISTEGQSEGNSEEESLYRDRREGAGEAMVEILREERQIA